MLKTFWRWLVYSSADANKFSLTVKAVLIGALTFATTLAGFAQVQLPTEQLTVLVDQLIFVLQTFIGLCAGITAVYGAIRKLSLTYLGENAALK